MNGRDGDALQAIQVDSTRLDRSAVNLANATTPGFKREVAASARDCAATSFADLVEQQAAPVVANAGGRLALAVRRRVMRDMRVGTLKSTATAVRLRADGPGFFEVSTPHGPAYTRHGQFQLDARGRVVTAQGDAVMGTGGDRR